MKSISNRTWLEENPPRGQRGRAPGPSPPKKTADPGKESPYETNTQFFEEELHSTPQGDTYATVAQGCLKNLLLRKDTIMDLLTNPDNYHLTFRGWYLPTPPRLPPLTTEKGCFAFYVDGSWIENANQISCDDLRPWTSKFDSSIPGSANIKPNVRRHPVARLNGKLTVVSYETTLAEYHLTEYSARLPREPRLRKKIFYMTRDNQMYGNILILYNYVDTGNAPTQITFKH